MIYISSDSKDTELLDSVAKVLDQAGYTTQSIFDGSTLSAWLQENVVSTPTLSLGKNTGSANKFKSDNKDKHIGGYWSLNSSQLQLTAPNGQQINLSHDACCILQAVIRSNGRLVSRKRLVESMGYNFLHYDERRLESLISRLRRKLSSFSPDGFPIRAIKGHGYVFGVTLKEIDIQR